MGGLDELGIFLITGGYFFLLSLSVKGDEKIFGERGREEGRWDESGEGEQFPREINLLYSCYCALEHECTDNDPSRIRTKRKSVFAIGTRYNFHLRVGLN